MATNKYFKCPFCDKRRDRKSLVAHIESKHIDELPEGFTPLQATFHVANKKDFDYRPPCRICKSPTLWDEKKGRYNQLCGKQTCHDAYVEKMHRNMGDREGINRLTATPEGLEKMLAGRRISGKYKFQDGTYKIYTGSYELKALEFMDKVLNCKSEDVFAPGPVMEYILDGTKHFYITDLYYAPYNLIIEVKDGGDKPNTNPAFAETRRKVMAKEKFIIENTDYNYLRLTNNDFSQLLNVFADLKMSFNDSRIDNKNPRRVVHANEAVQLENMVGAIQAAMPPVPAKDDAVIINYQMNNVFTGKKHIAAATNIKFDKIFKQNEYTGIIEETDKNFLENCNYDVYIVKGALPRVKKLVEETLGTIQSPGIFFDSVFGHPEYTFDQIQYEENVVPIEDYYHGIASIDEAVRCFITEAVTAAKIAKVEEFNKELNEYDYGVVINGKPIHDLSAVGKDQYITSDAGTFGTYKIGTCWDYVNYEADWFRKNGIPYKAYFAIMGVAGKRVTPTHTFITFKDKDNKIYWFESAWGGNKGVRSYKDEKELFEDFKNRFTTKRKKWQEVDIYAYRPGSKYVGINDADFINKITTENTMIKQFFNKEGGNPNGQK